MPMTQEERIAADLRVRTALGVNRMGTGPDAPPTRPRPGSPLASTASTKLPIDDVVYGLQMYGYGEIWGRPGLSLRDRSFVTMALLAAMGQPDQFGIHVHNGLNLGITPEEITEVLVHIGAYAGVPMWHGGNNVLRYVFVERGILEAGSGAPYVPKPPTTHEERRANAERLRPALGVGRIGLAPDAPVMEPLSGGPDAVKAAKALPIEDDIRQVQADYMYGEVWSRPGLELRTRALIAVAVLQYLRLNDQLHSHINVALNLGVTPDELHELFLHASCYSGIPGWRNASNVARDVFIKRGIQTKA